jgi:hypothetical protein
MLGCILVCRLAEALKDRETDYSYVFVLYTDEEKGRKIRSSLNDAPFSQAAESDPAHVIEIDYVGDKALELGGRWIYGTSAGPTGKAGIKIASILVGSPNLHTAGDRIENVDLEKVHLALQTVQWMIEGLEAGRGLRAPDTVSFWRKDQ